MRQQLSSFAVVAGMLALACATATEDGALAGNFGIDDGGSGGGLNIAGMVNGTAGSITTAGSTNTTTGGNATGGSTSTGGTTPNAFGGSASTGGKPSGGSGGTMGGKANGGSANGGTAGTSSGGKGGSGGSVGTGGKASGGSASGGGGSGSGGTTSTTCNGVADWTSKTYAIGDTVADTCMGPFTGSCTSGQHHKFECNPPAGAPALPWCKDREPGVGNGWAEAWVDKGQCQ
jgi:hypothetical protein